MWVCPGPGVSTTLSILSGATTTIAKARVRGLTADIVRGVAALVHVRGGLARVVAGGGGQEPREEAGGGVVAAAEAVAAAKPGAEALVQAEGVDAAQVEAVAGPGPAAAGHGHAAGHTGHTGHTPRQESHGPDAPHAARGALEESSLQPPPAEAALEAKLC